MYIIFTRKSIHYFKWIDSLTYTNTWRQNLHGHWKQQAIILAIAHNVWSTCPPTQLWIILHVYHLTIMALCLMTVITHLYTAHLSGIKMKWLTSYQTDTRCSHCMPNHLTACDGHVIITAWKYPCLFNLRGYIHGYIHRYIINIHGCI